MRRRHTIVGCLALAGVVLLPVATANAEGGDGRSFCSESGQPTGEFAGDVFDGSPYGNAGEVVSWFARRRIEPIDPWGQTVKVFCDPRAS